MVADDGDDVATQFNCAVPRRQVDKAMVIRRNQDGELGTMIAQWQVVLDLVLNGQRVKTSQSQRLE